MADPKKMAAFLGNFEEAPVQSPPAAAMAPVDAPMGDEGDEGEAAEEDGEDEEKYADLKMLLEEHSEQVEELALALSVDPAEVLGQEEHEEDDVDLAMEAYDDLEPELQEAMMVLIEAEPRDYEQLAQGLLVEDMIEDDMAVAAFLCLVGHGLRQEAADEEGDKEDAEEDEDEEGDDDEDEEGLDDEGDDLDGDGDTA